MLLDHAQAGIENRLSIFNFFFAQRLLYPAKTKLPWPSVSKRRVNTREKKLGKEPPQDSNDWTNDDHVTNESATTMQPQRHTQARKAEGKGTRPAKSAILCKLLHYTLNSRHNEVAPIRSLALFELFCVLHCSAQRANHIRF